MKWWDQMPWSYFFECWVLWKLFPLSSSPSSRGSLDPLHFLPFEWYYCISHVVIMFEVKVKVLVAQSCPILCGPWTVALPAPPSMEFSRQEYWSKWLFHSLGDLLDPGIELWSSALKTNSLASELHGKPINMFRNVKSYHHQAYVVYNIFNVCFK